MAKWSNLAYNKDMERYYKANFLTEQFGDGLDTRLTQVKNTLESISEGSQADMVSTDEFKSGDKPYVVWIEYGLSDNPHMGIALGVSLFKSVEEAIEFKQYIEIWTLKNKAYKTEEFNCEIKSGKKVLFTEPIWANFPYELFKVNVSQVYMK